MLLLDLHRDVSGGSKVVWYSYLLKNFPVCCDPHSQRLQCSQWSRNRCFSGILLLFLDPTDVGNLISGSSAISKCGLNIWKFRFMYCWSLTWRIIENYFASVSDKCNCAVVWTFFGIAFLWDWNEDWPFPVLWPLLSFPSFLVYWMQHFNSIIFWIWNSSTGFKSYILSM